MEVSPAGDVDPVLAGGVSFQEELVVGAVVSDPAEPFSALADAGEEDVGSFAFQMLGTGYSAYEAVEVAAAVATADVDGPAIVLSQGLQNLLAQVLEVGDGFYGRLVANAMLGGCGALREFFQAEVRREVLLSFHFFAFLGVLL